MEVLLHQEITLLDIERGLIWLEDGANIAVESARASALTIPDVFAVSIFKGVELDGAFELSDSTPGSNFLLDCFVVLLLGRGRINLNLAEGIFALIDFLIALLT